MTKLLVTLFALLLLSFEAGAATWYVRPASAEYGAEDGTSYATAFDGYADIVWGGAGVVAGDTLVMCGTFNDNAAFNVGASGSAGSVITIDGDCSSQGDLPRAKLVAGTGGAVAASNGLNTYVTFKNLEAVGGSAITQRVFNVGATAAASATAINVTLDNIIVHDTMGEGGTVRNVDYQCMRVDGSNVTATNITLYNCEGDGVYAEGNDHSWDGVDIATVDLSATPYGDCIQYGGGAASTEYAHNRVTITDLTCDHTNKATKHGVIFGCDTGAGTSTGLILQDSRIYGGAYNVGVHSCDGVTIRRNYFVPTNLASAGRGIGTFNGSSGETLNIQSNIFNMQDVAANSAAIFIDTGSGFTLNAHNNVMYGNGDESNSFGVYVYLPSSGTVSISNNVIAGMTGRPISVGASATGTASYNALFNNALACQTITCSNSITTDPAFLGGSSPTTADGFKLKSNSPLCGAGTPTDAKYDYGGYRFGIPPNIGAFATCERNDTFTDRTIFTDRTTYVDR